MDICAYHVHSHYSFGDSILDLDKMAKKCASAGIKSVVLTEHGHLASAMKFHSICESNGIKPIHGVEVYVKNENAFRDKEEKEEPDDLKEDHIQDEDHGGNPKEKKSFHLVLVARNKAGLIELQNICGDAYRNNFVRKPMVNSKTILEYARNGNIICGTACLGSQFSSLIRSGLNNDLKNLLMDYKNAFGDYFFVEIQLNEMKDQIEVNTKLIESASKVIGTNCFIYGMDAHYLNAEDYSAREMVRMIRQKKTIDSETYKPSDVKDIFLKTYADILESYSKCGRYVDSRIFARCIKNTMKLDEICENYSIKSKEWHLPKYVPFDDEIKTYGNSCKEIFAGKVKDGFDNLVRFGKIPQDRIDEYSGQIAYETKIISDKGFEDYFLVAKDAMDYAVKNGARQGPGRGSASSSIIAWCLGLTDLDPIHHGLIFERFLSPSRNDLVDLDLDISSEEKELIEPYLKKRYGIENVAHVAIYGTYGAKTLIRDIARVMGWPYPLANEVSKHFDLNESFEDGCKRLIDNKIVKQDAIDFIQEHYDEYKSYIDKLDGLVRNLGKHAAGVVVAPDRIENFVPVHRLDGQIMASYTEGSDSRELSDSGLAKFDFLGLTGCSVIRDAEKLIKKNRDVSIEIPFYGEDKDVYQEIFATANCDFIFQFASQQMKSLLKQANPKCLQDIANINGLYRPAVIKAGGIERYFDGKKTIDSGREIEYAHESMKSVLDPTYGTFVFQEQLMQITKDVAGFSMSEAEDFRKTLKLYKLLNEKRDSNDTVVAEHWKKFNATLEKFKNGCIQYGKLTEEKADELFHQIGKYSDYLFNKCLGENSRVITPNGCVLIRDINIGDTVFSYDYESKITYETKVKDKINSGMKNCFKIMHKDGTSVECTLDHKFMSLDGKMIPMSQILAANSDAWAEIEYVTDMGKCQTYDLEIDDKNHNFLLDGNFVTSNSHSLSYSIIAFQMAWLQHYYPVEFFACVLAHTVNKDQDLIDAIRYIKNSGIEVIPPDINMSQAGFSIRDNKIYFGLDFIKGIGGKDCKKIVDGQPYKNANDLIYKLFVNGVNKRAVEGIIMPGLCDSLFLNRKKLLTAWEAIRASNKGTKRPSAEETKKLIDDTLRCSIEDFSKYEKIAACKQFFGFYFGSHPIEMYSKYFAMLDCVSPSNVDLNDSGVRVGGIVASVDHRITKSKKPYVIIGIEDNSSKIVFKGWNAFVNYLEKHNIVPSEGDFIVVNLNNDKFGYTIDQKTLYEKDLGNMGYIDVTKLAETDN